MVFEVCKEQNPARELSIDETLLLYKGRLPSKQLVRTKRARFHAKSFVFTHSKGHMLHFHPYVSALTQLDIEDTGESAEKLSKSERVVA